MDDSNRVIVEAWNTVLFDKFCRFKHLLVEGLAQHSDAALAGPFSMSGPDMVSGMLRGAGFQNITFERYDCDICIGRDLSDAIEFAMALGPAGEIIRLAGETGEACKPEVVEALTEVWSRHRRDDGVWAPSSTWIVTATNPA